MCSLGGAANVAMNLAGFGNKVELIGMISNDGAGRWLKSFLNDKGIGINGVFCADMRPTIRKVRFSSTQQSILRVDYENSEPIENSIAMEMAAYIGFLPKLVEKNLFLIFKQ